MTDTIRLLVDALADPKTRNKISWLTVAQIAAEYNVSTDTAIEAQQLAREML
jgi:hypothetical protein